jgi:ATP-binding cassette subfamily F protein 3
MTETEIRSALAMFLFRGDDVYKSVSKLSGGERAKLSLLKIMLARPNLLILDEPTNHLDITSREVLEEALANYDGTLLVVSHDRYFINKLASKIIHLTHTGAINIDGNYDTYLQYHEGVVTSEYKESRKKPAVNEYKLRKEQASLERKRKSDIAKTEKLIEEKETLISEIETALSNPETSGDYERLIELTESLDATKNELEELYLQWEELQTTE